MIRNPNIIVYVAATKGIAKSVTATRPSALAVLLAALAHVSAGRLLMAGVFPGLMMAVIYGIYISIRIRLNPSLAPTYDYQGVALREKLMLTAKLAPLGVIIFMVMGFIILGIATPSEAAATGALGAIVVTAIYGRLTFRVLGRALAGVTRIAGMVMLIIAGAQAFGQMLSMTGASQSLFEALIALDANPTVMLLVIQGAVLFLGLFIDPIAIMLITIPILTPLIAEMGWDPIWFYLLFLMNIVIGNESPPFGLTLFVLTLFVLKGVLRHVSIGEIYRAQIPFIALDVMAMLIVIAFPQIALWLPSQIR
jgi:tripartite ATP-independent transporter DctM subunit